MTLIELMLIQEKLRHVPGCFTEEQRMECASCAETKRALDIIEREIKLKKMDPRKNLCETNHESISRERKKKGFKPMPCPDCGELI